MEQVAIAAQTRDGSGTSAARRLRRQGFVPGVAYGLGKDTVNLAVERRALTPVLRHGGNVVIDLDVSGVPKEPDIAALLKEVQRHPLSGEVLCVDFQWISLKEAVEVEVPVVTVGASPGVVQGGVLEHVLFQVRIRCLPTQIPEHLVVDISGMDIGDTRHVADLQAPEGVEILTPAEDTVVTIGAPVKAEDLQTRTEEEVAEELEELAEGEEAAPEKEKAAAEPEAEEKGEGGGQ